MELLENQLERIAGDLVMVGLDDLPALARIHDDFSEFSQAVADENATVSMVAHNCSDLIEKIVVNDIDDKESALQILNDAVVGMQSVIRDKRELTEVHWPPELGLPGSEAGEDVPAPEVEGVPGKSATPPPAEAVEEEPLIMNFDGVDISILAEFITEGREHCATAEQMMMDLETGGDDEASINAIFRSFHTIKGAAGFLDLRPVSVLAHESETLLDLWRARAAW